MTNKGADDSLGLCLGFLGAGGQGYESRHGPGPWPTSAYLGVSGLCSPQVDKTWNSPKP